MDFRVYDKKKKKWVSDILLTPDGELFMANQTFFGRTKLTFLHQDRYVYQRSIELYDKNERWIYIGDYVRAQVAEDKVVTGVVTYANELSAYVILCFDVDEYYTLGAEVCEYIEVVGNVFDEFFEKDEKSGQQAL